MRTVAAVILSAPGLMAPGASVIAMELGGEITVTTDYMFRGVSQTMSEPALQAGIAAGHDSGWYGWAWVSNVDFVAPGGPDDGAELEANFAIGYDHDVNEAVSVSLEGVAYRFPGMKAGYDYDYAELLVGFELWEQHRLVLGYSGDVFNAGGVGRYYAAASTFDLAPRLSLDIELGYYDLHDAFDASYAYAETAINYEFGALHWRLSYVMNDDAARTLFDESTVRNRLVAAVSVAF